MVLINMIIIMLQSEILNSNVSEVIQTDSKVNDSKIRCSTNMIFNVVQLDIKTGECMETNRLLHQALTEHSRNTEEGSQILRRV